MIDKTKPNLGIVFRPEQVPENLPAYARRAEEAGFDELWVWEDCFLAGGIASAAVALANTETITVGAGILPAVVRNPVFAAMEIATLARFYPGRFLPGFGHGVAGWMRQIGAFPKSQLAALEDVAVIVRAMLAGEQLTYEGKEVQLHDVALAHPPDPAPPVSLGVRGPKSLALSGRVSDGTILAEYAAPAYITWAREQIAKGQGEAGHDRPHRITVFVLASAGETTAEAQEAARPVMAAAIYPGYVDSQLVPLGILPEVEALREQSADSEEFAAAMPAAWIEQLAVAGTPADWDVAIDRFAAAGVDSVVLVPAPGKGIEELNAFAAHIRRRSE